MRLIPTLLLLASTPIAVVQDFEPKPARSEFDMKVMREFINHALSVARPRGSLRKLGEPKRVIHGRLLDYHGQPIVGAQVCLAQDIGYSHHAYDENFDLTDEQGRFVVEGDFPRRRIAIWRAKGQAWNVPLVQDNTKVELQWPAPATCSVTLDESLRNNGQFGSELTLETAGYAIGMSSLRRTIDITGEEPTVIKDLLPGEYSVQVPKTVSLGGDTPEIKTWPIEVGRFTIEAGQSINVHAKAQGSRRLSGQLKATPPAGAIVLDAKDLPKNEVVKVDDATVKKKAPEKMFVEVRQQKTRYEQTTQIVDLLVTDKNLRFQTRPLPPGRYLLTFSGRTPKAAPNNNRGRGFGGWNQPPQAPQMKYRIVIPETDKPVKLTFPPEDSLAVRIQQTLDTDGQRNVSWSYSDVQAMQIARQEDSIPELLRLLGDNTTPQSWEYPLVKALSRKLDDPKIVRELIRLAQATEDQKKRYSIISQTLRTSKILREEIAMGVEPFRKDSDFRTRHMAYTTLPVHVTDKNRDQVVPWLIEGLSDPYPRTRYDIAAWLRRVDGKAAVPELKRLAKDDPSNAVRVTAAHAVAMLTGETNKAIQMMTVILNGDTYCGQWEAAQLLSEYEQLPAITIRTLKRKIKTVKAPFDTVEKYEDNRISRTARLTLKKVASK